MKNAHRNFPEPKVTSLIGYCAVIKIVGDLIDWLIDTEALDFKVRMH